MRKTLSFILTLSTILTFSNSALSESETSEIQAIARDIHSIKTAKEFLQNNITCPDPTGCSGYGMWARAVHICKIVKAVDSRVGGTIIKKNSYSKKTISIFKSDINLMKMIYAQCKSNRYIDSASNPVELVYSPSPPIREKIDRLLR
jgi:hypothetical protein